MCRGLYEVKMADDRHARWARWQVFVASPPSLKLKQLHQSDYYEYKRNTSVENGCVLLLHLLTAADHKVLVSANFGVSKVRCC